MIMGAEVKGGSAEDQVQGIKLFGATILLQVKQEPPKLSTNTTDHPHPHHHRHHQDQDQQQQQEMKRPDKIIPCPRCKSMETKFCYFNNYNVNQPRHFCKGCQRYWTAGGALRNVPVGAGRRKSKPPGRGDCTLGGAGFPGNCIFDASGMHQYPSAAAGQFDLDRVMVGEWQIAAARGGLSDGGGFGDDFPAKRLRRSGSGGQTC